MEILPGVHRIANAVSTAYLLVDRDDGLTLIDAGPGHFDRVIVRYLGQIGRRPDEIRRIILTHRHFDHIGGARAMRAASRASVFAHPLDAPQIDGRKTNRMPKGAIGVGMRALVPIVFPWQPCPVDESLADGQTFAVGGLGELRVLLTPGHTLGHCALLLPARNLLIAGDALTHIGAMPSTSFDAVNDDTALAHQTVIDLATLSVANVVFGHGNPILGNGQAALHAAAEQARRALAKMGKTTASA
jgi:glyoxylase-like metal-dependent hydrolase (beta-lactamase superfamily II)